MKPETDEQFIIASRAVAMTFQERFTAMGMTPDEVANMSGGALAEVLAQQLGSACAVERLRQIADLLERQLFNEMDSCKH